MAPFHYTFISISIVRSTKIANRIVPLFWDPFVMLPISTAQYQKGGARLAYERYWFTDNCHLIRTTSQGNNNTGSTL